MLPPSTQLSIDINKLHSANKNIAADGCIIWNNMRARVI